MKSKARKRVIHLRSPREPALAHDLGDASTLVGAKYAATGTLDAAFARIEALERKLTAGTETVEKDGWRSPQTAPRDGYTRALVLAVMSDGSALPCFAISPNPMVPPGYIPQNKWLVQEGGAWYADILGWMPAPEVPEEFRKAAPKVGTSQMIYGRAS